MEDPLKPRGTGERYTTTVRIGVPIGSLYGLFDDQSEKLT